MRNRPFARLAEGVVMSVSAGAAGCGGLDTEGIEPIACVEESPEERSVGSQQPDWLGAITPTRKLDAIEMWDVAGLPGATRADVRIVAPRA